MGSNLEKLVNHKNFFYFLNLGSSIQDPPYQYMAVLVVPGHENMKLNEPEEADLGPIRGIMGDTVAETADRAMAFLAVYDAEVRQ